MVFRKIVSEIENIDQLMEKNIIALTGHTIQERMLIAEINQRKKEIELILDSYKKLVERNTKELERARDVQRFFLPKLEKFKHNSYLGVDCRWTHLNYVSGDMPLISNTLKDSKNNEIGVLLIDVEGHGPDAAGLTFLIRSIGKELLEEDAHLYWKTPAKFMQVFNAKVNHALKNAPHFCTALYGYFQPNPEDETTIFSWAKAGSPYPILYSDQDKRAKFLNTTGRPLRFDTNSSFQESSTTLYPNDRLFIVSDGVLEQEFKASYEGILPESPEFYSRPAATTINEALDQIEEELNNKNVAKDKHDDQTIIAFQNNLNKNYPG